MIYRLLERRQCVNGWSHMTGHSPPAASTVLVVEDDFFVRSCAVEALSECGFAVLEAANGPDGLRILEGAHVDVVFTDINMPGEFDGLGLAWRVRHRWPDIAVVITSGRGCPDHEAVCARFLPKPYMPDSLGRLIDEVVACHGEQATASTLGRMAR